LRTYVALSSFFFMDEMRRLEDPRLSDDGGSESAPSEADARAPFLAQTSRHFFNMQERPLPKIIPAFTLAEHAAAAEANHYNVRDFIVDASPAMAEYNAGREGFECLARPVAGGKYLAFKSESLLACMSLPGFGGMSNKNKAHLCMLGFDEIKTS
jgi:hypothetical protein